MNEKLVKLAGGEKELAAKQATLEVARDNALDTIKEALRNAAATNGVPFLYVASEHKRQRRVPVALKPRFAVTF